MKSKSAQSQKQIVCNRFTWWLASTHWSQNWQPYDLFPPIFRVWYHRFRWFKCKKVTFRVQPCWPGQHSAGTSNCQWGKWNPRPLQKNSTPSPNWSHSCSHPNLSFSMTFWKKISQCFLSTSFGRSCPRDGLRNTIMAPLRICPKKCMWLCLYRFQKY